MFLKEFKIFLCILKGLWTNYVIYLLLPEFFLIVLRNRFAIMEQCRYCNRLKKQIRIIPVSVISNICYMSVYINRDCWSV